MNRDQLRAGIMAAIREEVEARPGQVVRSGDESVRVMALNAADRILALLDSWISGDPESDPMELARQDGFVAGTFWAARYVDERDMKPTGAEISHEAQAHSRMRMKQPGGPFAGLRRRLEAGEIGLGQNVRRLDERVLAEIATEGGLDATTVGSVEIDEPICERCGQRQPLVSMHFCGGKSAALFTADTLSVEVLNEMAGYKPNWDSYGSPPIHREALESAAWLLLYFHSVNRSSEVVPHVGPVSGGGIQIDWDTKDRSLELEIYPDGRLEYLATAQNQESCSGLIADIEQLAELLSWVSRT